MTVGGGRVAVGRLGAGALLLSALGGACGGASLPAEEGARLFGDDRLGDALRNHFGDAPGSFPELEALLKVGRRCERPDSAELYVIEEPTTRLGGSQQDTPSLLPRVLVTGCSGDRTAEGALARGALFVAVVSRASGGPPGDPLALEPVEVMARDRSTGLYNFYVLRREQGAPVVERLVEDADGAVTVWTKAGSAPLRREVAPEPRCFSCHRAGAPVLNELTDPWTGWLSVRKASLAGPPLVGESAAIVAGAAEGGGARPSLASALEVTLRASLGAFAREGLGPALLQGRAAGGWERALRAMLCETTLQYLSPTETLPVELFADPAAMPGGVLQRPSTTGAPLPPLLPVRSLLDASLEAYLVAQGYITADTVRAVRMLDDERDVFSQARCGLLAPVLAEVPSPSASLGGVVTKRLDALRREGLYGAGARADCAAGLLAGEGAARCAPYADELRARVAAGAAGLTTPEGHAAAVARVRARQEEARVLFPGAAHPLPYFGAQAAGSARPSDRSL